MARILFSNPEEVSVTRSMKQPKREFGRSAQTPPRIADRQERIAKAIRDLVLVLAQGWNTQRRVQLYLRVNRELWLRVTKAVAEAKGIPKDGAEMKTVRREVLEARFEIGFTAKSIVPKASQIEDYHHLIASTPPPHMITRRHFEGLSP